MNKMRIISTVLMIFVWLVTAAFQPLPQAAWLARPTSIIPAALPADFSKLTPGNGDSVSPLEDVVLTWEASSPGVIYQYCSRPNKKACPANKWISVGSSTQATLQGLTPGNTYYWQVRAIANVGGEITEANQGTYWTFTVQSSALLPGAFGKSAPVDPSLDVDVNELGLSWETSPGATSYEYCY